MATYYIDPTAPNGSGSFANPWNTVGTFASGDTLLFKEGTVSNRGASSWIIGVAVITIGVYDATTGSRVIDGSKVAVLSWRNTLTGSSALVIGASVTTLDMQGIKVKTGWIVNHNGVTYQCKLAHTSSSANEPGTAGGNTYWYTHRTVLADQSAWATGVSYVASGSAVRIYNPITSPIIKHVETEGGTGFSCASAGIVTPIIDNILSSFAWSVAGAVTISGTLATPLLNPTITNVSTIDSAGYGVQFQYINGTGAGMVIDNIESDYGTGVIFQGVTGVHSITDIRGYRSAGSGVIVDSRCTSLTIDGVDASYNSDNGFSGADVFSAGNPPTNCTITNFKLLYNGNSTLTVDPATDGDGFSCHAGTGWVFDTGISCFNANSGESHVGSSTGTVRNAVITKNGYQPNGAQSPARYKRGGLALVAAGVWTHENCIIDDNLPYNIKLDSAADFVGDTNLIGEGTFTTDLSNSFTRDEFIAAVTAGGGACTNVVTGVSLLDPDDDFAPLPGSAAIGTGKGVGIGSSGIDFNGNQRPAPEGAYNIGHRENYPTAKAGYSPWVHFDTTMPTLELAAAAPGKLQKVQVS